jgi:hypothetical protein
LAILWFIYDTVHNQPFVTANELIIGLWRTFEFQQDTSVPQNVEAAQRVHSPFVDQLDLQAFVQLHGQQAGGNLQLSFYHQLAHHLIVMQCQEDGKHNDDDDDEEDEDGEHESAISAETYLCDEDEVSVLSTLTFYILEAIQRDGVQVDTNAVIAAIQIASHIIGYGHHKMTFEEQLLRYCHHLQTFTTGIIEMVVPTIDNILPWQMAIGLWFGPVHQYIKTRWSAGPLQLENTASLRSMYMK